MQSTLQRLQLLQNYAARLVYRIPKFCHITPYLKDLHLCKQEFSSNCYLLYLNAYMETVLNICPSYSVSKNDAPWPKICQLLQTIHLNSQERNHWGRNEAQQTVRFQFLDPNSVWNQLPASIRNSCSLDAFKSRLKTFLFNFFFLFEHLTSF